MIDSNRCCDRGCDSSFVDQQSFAGGQMPGQGYKDIRPHTCDSIRRVPGSASHVQETVSTMRCPMSVNTADSMARCAKAVRGSRHRRAVRQVFWYQFAFLPSL